MDVAYIYSHDGDKHGIKFDIELCTQLTLRETVKNHMYPEGVPDGDTEIFDGIMEEIAEKNACDFEDGWIAVKYGVPAIIEFLIEQLREAKAEESAAYDQCAKEGARRATAETKYAALCEALIGAIDTQAPAIRAIAANGGVAVSN